MKKLMVSGALALALSGVAMAEESGGFVGVDLGVNGLSKMQSVILQALLMLSTTFAMDL